MRWKRYTSAYEIFALAFNVACARISLNCETLIWRLFILPGPFRPFPVWNREIGFRIPNFSGDIASCARESKRNELKGPCICLRQLFQQISTVGRTFILQRGWGLTNQ